MTHGSSLRIQMVQWCVISGGGTQLFASLPACIYNGVLTMEVLPGSCWGFTKLPQVHRVRTVFADCSLVTFVCGSGVCVLGL